MTQTTIYITKTDAERLGNLIELTRDHGDRGNLAYVNTLEEELDFAEIVPSTNVRSSVVTMRSKIKLRDLDTGEENTYSIVFPSEADLDEGKISILTPLATAVLGRELGETVEFQAPARLRRLKITKIVYQPESAGDYDL
jgi:regulator of nucleoside diphosphate kinase